MERAHRPGVVAAPTTRGWELALGHGASGTSASMRPWVEALGRRGLSARAIDLPRRRAEDAVPAFLAALTAGPRLVPGGHSFGGRVASLAAARLVADGTPPGALVLLSYPLHPPGGPEAWDARTAHWPALRCPVLLLSGESDAFARLPLLRDAAHRLPDARLVTFPRLGHGLLTVVDEASATIAEFLAALVR